MAVTLHQNVANKDSTFRLRQCPSCASDYVGTWPNCDYPDRTVAGCLEYGCGMRVDGPSEAEAVAKWNRRRLVKEIL